MGSHISSISPGHIFLFQTFDFSNVGTLCEWKYQQEAPWTLIVTTALAAFLCATSALNDPKMTLNTISVFSYNALVCTTRSRVPYTSYKYRRVLNVKCVLLYGPPFSSVRGHSSHQLHARTIFVFVSMGHVVKSSEHSPSD